MAEEGQHNHRLIFNTSIDLNHLPLTSPITPTTNHSVHNLTYQHTPTHSCSMHRSPTTNPPSSEPTSSSQHTKISDELYWTRIWPKKLARAKCSNSGGSHALHFSTSPLNSSPVSDPNPAQANDCGRCTTGKGCRSGSGSDGSEIHAEDESREKRKSQSSIDPTSKKHRIGVALRA